MLECIRHRGPDGEGIWREGEVWLGHRRLAIIDVTELGAQPMVSHCGRYVLTYNGELYNCNELRLKLERRRRIAWRGHSDTEVLLEGIAEYGVRACLTQANGMFGFALWDRAEKRLTLARDRLGEKPLYFTEQGSGFAFASELRALGAVPGLHLKIDQKSLYWFFHYGYVPAPMSIYAGVSKLPPGCIASFAGGKVESVESYWTVSEAAEMCMQAPFQSDAEMLAAIETALLNACKIRMVSDVPLGAFLSGGVDSSTIVAMMQASSSRPVKTFTIGFDAPAMDEAGHARAVAKYLGTDHTEYTFTEKDVFELIPKLGKIIDEPFADSSILPTHLVSLLARRSVTVCLTGDGGDELFAGYERHRKIPEIWSRIERLPSRKVLAQLLKRLPTQYLDKLLQPVAGTAAKMGSTPDSVGVKAQRLAERLHATKFEEYYDYVMRVSPLPEEFVAAKGAEPWLPAVPSFSDMISWMCWIDAVTYLPGDILTKVDRASMAVGLEGRMPMLDPGVVEAAWRIPVGKRIRNGQTKWPLRQILYSYVPPSLIERPKMGFGIPLREWLSGPLREWTLDLLNTETIRFQGLINPAAVERCIDNYFTGRRPEPTTLWALLMFQVWFNEQV